MCGYYVFCDDAHSLPLDPPGARYCGAVTNGTARVYAPLTIAEYQGLYSLFTSPAPPPWPISDVVLCTTPDCNNPATDACSTLPPPASNALAIGLGVGLGVGIPVLIAVGVAVYFFAFKVSAPAVLSSTAGPSAKAPTDVGVASV